MSYYPVAFKRDELQNEMDSFLDSKAKPYPKTSARPNTRETLFRSVIIALVIENEILTKAFMLCVQI